jgi:hypothetical protein
VKKLELGLAPKFNASSKTTEIYTHVSTKSTGEIRSPMENLNLEGGDIEKFECGRGCFDLRPDVKYLHLGATTQPNLGAKLHLCAIGNKLCGICFTSNFSVLTRNL